MEKTKTLKYLNFIGAVKESLLKPELPLETIADVISRQLSQSQLNHLIDYFNKQYEGRYGEKTHRPYTKRELREKGYLI